MVKLERIGLGPEIPYAHLEVRALERAVHAHARIGAGNGPGNRLGPVPRVLAVIEKDPDTITGNLLGGIVRDVILERVFHRGALIHGNSGAEDRQDAAADQRGVHPCGTGLDPVFLRPEHHARKQGQDGYDQ